MKFFLPEISLNSSTPHKLATRDGPFHNRNSFFKLYVKTQNYLNQKKAILPLVTIGKVIACVSALLARKNDEFPIPHIRPSNYLIEQIN